MLEFQRVIHKIAATGILVIPALLSACSASAPYSDRTYDHGYRAPKRYDPSVIQSGPSHSLPAQDPYAELRASLPALAAPANTHYVPLPAATDLAALMTGDPDAGLAALRSQASATPEYHQQLVSMLTAAPAVDGRHAEMLLRAVYFAEPERRRLERAERMLSEIDDPAAAPLQTGVRANLALAHSFVPFAMRILSESVARATDLTPDSGLVLLEHASAADAGLAAAAFTEYLQRLVTTPGLDADQTRAFLALAKRKAQFAIAGPIAARAFAQSLAEAPAASAGGDAATSMALGTAHALLELCDGFPPGSAALDALLMDAAPRVRTGQTADVRALIHLLGSDDAVRAVAPRLIAVIPALTLDQFLATVDAREVGPGRDDVVRDAVGTLPASLTPAQAYRVLQRTYLPENMAELARRVFGRLGAPLSASALTDVAARFYRGHLRDQLLLGGIRTLAPDARASGAALDRLLDLASSSRARAELSEAAGVALR